MRQFMTFDEAAAELETDLEGLRQGFETGLARGLPAYAYSGTPPFLASLTGCKVESADEFPLLRLADGRAIGCGFPFDQNDGDIDPSELGDQFGDVAESGVETGKAVAFELRGYFRIAAYELKKAARTRFLDARADVAPASWWTDASPMPRRDNGSPRHLLTLLTMDWSSYPEPHKLSDLLFRLDDLRAWKAARTPSPPTAKDKPLDERERASLLCIIGALASNANLDLSQPHKAGAVVAAMLPADVKLSARTIGEHLKSVREAMDNRKV